MIVINSRSRIRISVCSLIIASSNVLAFRCSETMSFSTFFCSISPIHASMDYIKTPYIQVAGVFSEMSWILPPPFQRGHLRIPSHDKKNAATRTGDSVKFCIIYLIGKFYNSTLPFPFLPYFIPYHIRFLPYFYRTLDVFYRTFYRTTCRFYRTFLQP